MSSNRQFVEALRAAHQEGYIKAMRDTHARMSAEVGWASAKEKDDEYHRGLRDGIIRAWEAIGLQRWTPTNDTKSGK